jgi:hypothetical protein
LPAKCLRELVDGTIADQLADAVVIAAPARSGFEQRYLFGEAERIAARDRLAASLGLEGDRVAGERRVLVRPIDPSPASWTL